MARPPLASVEDLEEALGVEVDNEGQANSLLRRASAIVRAFARQTWLNDDETDLVDVPADIPDLVVGMVERATRNPTGVTQEQEQAGPFSRSRSFGADASQRLYLTRSDKLVIGAVTGSAGIGTISTTRGPLETAGTCDSDLFPEEVLETMPWPS